MRLPDFKTSTNALLIINWRTLLHMRRADDACALCTHQAAALFYVK